MTRNLLFCLGFAVAFTAATVEVRAEPRVGPELCEPTLEPALCIPGISTSPDCRVDHPVGAPAAGGMLRLTAPELVLPMALPDPTPALRGNPAARFAMVATHPGYARDIDRPPKASS